MKNRQFNILFSAFVVLLLAHLFFKPLQWFEVHNLEGFYTKPKEPSFCIDSILDGRTQKQLEEVTVFHNGLRTLGIRIHNELKYDLYRELKLQNCHFGKNGYIFEYPAHFYFKIKADTSRINQYVNRYLHLVEVMKKQGIPVVWVIAPDKCYVYPEYLPHNEKFELDTEISEYLAFRKAMIERKAPMIDFNYLAFKEKNKYDFPIMYKRGKHWSRPYALRCMDSLFRYMNVNYNCGPKASVEYFKTDNPYRGDFDQANAMNLLFVADGKNWTDARLKMKEEKKLKMLWFGDSFTHVVYWSGYFHSCFSDSSEFWYYNRERNTIDSADLSIGPRVYRTAKDFKFMVIEFSALNVSSLDWGTVDSLSHYYP